MPHHQGAMRRSRLRWIDNQTKAMQRSDDLAHMAGGLSAKRRAEFFPPQQIMFTDADLAAPRAGLRTLRRR